MKHRAAVVAAVLAAALATLAASNARADSTGSEYDARKARVMALQQEGDRRGAIQEMEAMFALRRDPNLLFNVAVNYKRLGLEGEGNVEDLQRAVDYYDQYLEEFRRQNGIDATDRRVVERNEAELKGRIAALKPPLVAPTEPSTQESSAAASPNVAPPDRSDLASAGTGSARRVAWRRPTGWALLGVGLAAAGTGAGLVSYCAATLNCGATTSPEYDGRQTAINGTGGALLALGGAAAVAAIVLLALPVRAGAPVTWWIAPTRAGVLVAGTFDGL